MAAADASQADLQPPAGLQPQAPQAPVSLDDEDEVKEGPRLAAAPQAPQWIKLEVGRAIPRGKHRLPRDCLQYSPTLESQWQQLRHSDQPMDKPLILSGIENNKGCQLVIDYLKHLNGSCDCHTVNWDSSVADVDCDYMYNFNSCSHSVVVLRDMIKTAEYLRLKKLTSILAVTLAERLKQVAPHSYITLFAT